MSNETEMQTPPPSSHEAPQCCMCGKKNLSTVEGDGGSECELTDGRWVCSSECWDRAVEPPPSQHVCASDGCEKPATERFEAGGVGSVYCSDCAAKVSAVVSTPVQHLRVTNPATISDFVRTLSDHGVKLPLLEDDGDIGTLVDANGKPVLVVDVNRERSDEDVAWIRGMIQVAVNTCGGFKAQRRDTTEGQDNG